MLIISREPYNKNKHSPPKVRTLGGEFLISDSSLHYLLAVEDEDALRQLNIEDGTLKLWPCKSLFSVLYSLFPILYLSRCVTLQGGSSRRCRQRRKHEFP